MKQNKALYLSAALLISIFILSFLSSCNDDRKCENIIIHEDFTPIGLPQTAHMLCFESDSIGYAATPILEDINGRCHIEESVISKTVDRGRTWYTLGKVDGKCINISEYGQRIFVTTTNQFQRNQEQGGMKSEIWVISKDALKKTKIAQEGDNIFGLHIFNDSTYTYCLNHNESFSYKITRNYGRVWETVYLPGQSVGNKIAFCGNTMLIPIFAKVDSTSRSILLAKDIMSPTYKMFEFKNLYDIQAADFLVALYSDMSFWKYDGENMKYLSKFRWNGLFRGCYHPKFLTESNGVFICAASNFSAEKGRHNCIFYSSDFGKHWKPLLISDSIWLNEYMFNESAMASIPEKEGASIIYQNSEDKRLHIIKVQKSDNAGD